MKILLFGGFLGSGKTSVILQAARYLVEKESQRVAIVENEIGEVGIDDQVIAAQGLQVKGVFAGCVCCQVTGDLLVAINEIHETLNPDWLIIETTGLAEPGKVVNILKTYCHCYDGLKIVVIVDAERWPELYEVAEPLVVAQVRSAEVILLNKVELLDADTCEGLVRDLKGHNGEADFFLITAQHELSLEVLREMTVV